MSLSPSCVVDVFGSPVSSGAFTWTKRPGAKTVLVQLVGSGPGGQAGAVAATIAGGATFSTGGSGGCIAFMHFPADILGATEAVNVAAGGTGGVGTGVTGAGAQGVDGAASNFGGWLFGNGGQRNATVSSGIFSTVNTSGVGSNTSNGALASPMSAGAAGAGNGIAGSLPQAGGVGQAVAGAVGSSGKVGVFTPLAGGTLGAINTAGGDGNSFGTKSIFGGSGGGGGGSSIVGVGGKGGNGGFPGGAGGAGGASVTPAVAGSGGNGANGIVVVTTFF